MGAMPRGASAAGGPALVVDSLKAATLGARATLLLKGLVQTLGELPERASRGAEMFVLFFESLNGFHASLERILSVLVGHSPPYPAIFEGSKNDAQASEAGSR